MTSTPSDRRGRAHRTKVSRLKAGHTGSVVKKPPGAKSSRDKVRAYRKRMRAKGFRLVQMWVPDTGTLESAGEEERNDLRTSRRANAALRKAWGDALTPSPRGYAKTIDDIAHLIGSVDGLPADLSARKKYYLKMYGYGHKRAR
jgi:hypothetical protein